MSISSISSHAISEAFELGLPISDPLPLVFVASKSLLDCDPGDLVVASVFLKFEINYYKTTQIVNNSKTYIKISSFSESISSNNSSVNSLIIGPALFLRI